MTGQRGAGARAAGWRTFRTAIKAGAFSWALATHPVATGLVLAAVLVIVVVVVRMMLSPDAERRECGYRMARLALDRPEHPAPRPADPDPPAEA
ncbi:hypothetical protein HS041_27155 [Planomonospora sp. ID67723]|uniref:hypothetical protein n=1 Tax=Planomonospora sp. ID67723 TaxID=2738134 RepID=UPI0018C374A7|nr:hypothetical protein [Planomonospora sp. ID67723]MBG0831429.1 hypothetical protein [Planomonospora sp. ID67723]